ncbi:hypothetical protein [Flavivirga sp. 57AJ16]|uniref:hypothetical protein n=1 Tax=Flavivirga sp. 57AJ16 TaxID=3025307 RepID=UPI002366D605|nr:hypothetical protein [Flavivirga sp. 57AJ16]MDD7888113.1 hypothetical protein [Flavivirga sp. 57AJ16]
MKKINLVIIVLSILCLSACSKDNDNNPENNAVSGTIQLSGTDTDLLGTSLKVGNIDVDGLDTTGTIKSVTLLDENTTIEDGELMPTNFSNAFVIVAAQFDVEDNADVEKAISMIILKNGEEYRYVCTSPSDNSSEDTDCGSGFSVDKTKKQVVFKNTTVINVDSETILTMNGTITWK